MSSIYRTVGDVLSNCRRTEYPRPLHESQSITANIESENLVFRIGLPIGQATLYLS